MILFCTNSLFLYIEILGVIVVPPPIGAIFSSPQCVKAIELKGTRRIVSSRV